MSDAELILSLPEEIPSLMAILGALLCWKLYALEVQLGRIHPKDVIHGLTTHFQRPSATPWLFIYLSNNDSQSCVRCTKNHLHVFLGSNLMEAAGQIHCVNSLGCRCIVIPIIGQWPAAERLRAQLSSQHGPCQLSEQDLHSLIHQGGNIGEQDQLARRLLRAIL